MQVVGSVVLESAQVSDQATQLERGCSMERGLSLYPLIYCALVILLVVIILLVASQVKAPVGPRLYDAIETLRFAV
jgi:hypothetical protein